MHWSKRENGRRRVATLYLVGGLWVSACGSGGGDPPASSSNTDTSPGGSSGSGGGSSMEQPPDPPGNLPNLGTEPGDPTDEESPEPADCEVLALAPCVTSALDALSSCLAAGHGGTFGEDTSRCDLPEADAVVTFSQAVPRWSTAFALGFVLDVGGNTCGRYTESSEGQSVASSIELITAQHEVTLETTADLQRTLTCDGVSVRFQQSNLARCRDSQAMPTPELADQTLNGVYQVSPMQQSNRRIFNCQFPSNIP